MNKCVELDILKSKMKLVHDIHKKISNGRNTITFGLKLQFLEILNTSFGKNPRQGKLFELMDDLGE